MDATTTLMMIANYAGILVLGVGFLCLGLSFVLAYLWSGRLDKIGQWKPWYRGG